MAYLKNSVRTPPFATVSVGSLNYVTDVNIFGNGWFRTLRRQRSFENVVLLAVVFADGSRFLPHLDMASKDM